MGNDLEAGRSVSDRLPRTKLISPISGWRHIELLIYRVIFLTFAVLSLHAPVYGQTSGETARPSAAQTVDAPAQALKQPEQPIRPATIAESKLQASSILRRRLPQTNAIDESNSPDSVETLISNPAASIIGASRAFLIAAETVLYLIVLLLAVYMLRHYIFTLNRLFARQRHPYVDIDTAPWPSITVFIAAHNEEAVIEDSIAALLEVDYPADRLTITPVNDRSKDRTRELIDAMVEKFPGRIKPFHRVDGKPGKAAALKDATELCDSDIIIIFDADYIPGRGLVKQLVAPFFDPEVGAVMGRVVPLNGGKNMLTRLLELERAGGYQVDQQARMNLGLVPQYGGTVGGIRKSALLSVGGWHDDVLAEDTDLTFRLLLGGWTTVYTNRSECYEEVPEDWAVRIKQIMRWCKGHNQALYRHIGKVARSKSLTVWERLDGVMLLMVYALSPVLMFGWLLALVLYLLKPDLMLSGAIALFSMISYSALGNFAAYFEIGAACYLDGSGRRLRLLPLSTGGFLVSLVAISRATFNQVVLDRFSSGAALKWDKTIRYRKRPT